MSGCYDVEELAGRGPVRITSADAWRILVPMLEPFRISSGEVSCKSAVLVRLSDGESWGWGESSAMPGGFYSAETPDSCERELIENVLPRIVERLWPTMGAFARELEELAPSRFVRVALETAAWEMLSRRAGVSLREYFGLPDGPVTSGLAVGLYNGEPALRAALERYGYRDYARLKVKIKRGQDIAVVRGVREHVGDFPLFVDANADYSLDDLEVFRELDRFGLVMFEQPFGREAMEESAELARAMKTPICMDESIETAEDARRAADLGACSIVNIKLQRVGGYLEAMRIAKICAERNIALWMGTMPELGVGSAQALMFATHPGCKYPTDVEPSARWYTDDVVAPELVLRKGIFEAVPGPGLGYVVDLEHAKPYLRGAWRFGR
jgi:o-succinylbenzoate synthase